MKRNVPKCILGVLLVVMCGGCSPEKYGIVARLGNDTISIERITRRGRRVVSDVAERSPRAVARALTNPLIGMAVTGKLALGKAAVADIYEGTLTMLD